MWTEACWRACWSLRTVRWMWTEPWIVGLCCRNAWNETAALTCLGLKHVPPVLEVCGDGDSVWFSLGVLKVTCELIFYVQTLGEDQTDLVGFRITKDQKTTKNPRMKKGFCFLLSLRPTATELQTFLLFWTSVWTNSVRRCPPPLHCLTPSKSDFIVLDHRYPGGWAVFDTFKSVT